MIKELCVLRNILIGLPFTTAILKAPPSHNYRVLKKEPNKKGEMPVGAGNTKKMKLPAGSEVCLSVSGDGDSGKVWRVSEYLPQSNHKAGVFATAEGEEPISLGPNSGRTEHPTLGSIVYINEKQKHFRNNK